MAIALQPGFEAPQKRVNARRPSVKDAPANSPFRYVYDPHAWAFQDDTGEFLPSLRNIKLDPGVGGVDEHGNPRRAMARMIDKGWTWLKADDSFIARFLGDDKGYCRSVVNAKGGVHWFGAFESARMVGNRTHWLPGGDESGAEKARASGEALESNVGRYRDFLRFLVKEHPNVGEIEAAVVEAEIEKARELHAEYIGRLGSNPDNGALRERVETMGCRVEAMRRRVPVQQIRDERAAAAAAGPAAPAKAATPTADIVAQAVAEALAAARAEWAAEPAPAPKRTKKGAA